MAAKLCEPECLSEIIRIGYSESSLELKKILDAKDENSNSIRGTFGGTKDNPMVVGDCDNDDNDNDSDNDDDEYEWNMDDINNQYDRYCWEQEEVFYKKYYKKKFLREIDFRDTEGLTAFQHCIQATKVPVEKKVECLRLLAQSGVDLTLKSDCEQNPIEMALDLGSDERVLACLIDFGCKVNLDECFSNAKLQRNIPLMNFFIERGANVHFINYLNQNCILHFLYNGDARKNMKEFDEVLRVLIQKYKVDINFCNQHSSIFSGAFYLLTKCNSFPLQFLMSENIDVISNANIDKEMPILDERQRREVRMPVKQYVQLLYDYNMPYDMLIRFIGTELDRDTKKWLNELFDSPSSLSKICKFSVRKCLGKDIKWKVEQLQVPEVIKDIILLKNLLSSECFN
ncbi:hypothetical protein LOTGIDRAFT_170069 [Lottia gigantea]|uniref:SOCS box domain-containing protein n=1 Tax=Lottia gigantea TaxID=225164 RepID=V3YWN3_LOTGI|nr:hypothetical protein LOTGIDRAFT_170069 [Lottia gigantea]ESO82438.1 hypothetical protein LOTGIDRAFT_170069 [Lottia gigantea]